MHSIDRLRSGFYEGTNVKKIRNDKANYLSRSALAQIVENPKAKPREKKDQGDFAVDSAGYFSWSKKRRLATR